MNSENKIKEVPVCLIVEQRVQCERATLAIYLPGNLTIKCFVIRIYHCLVTCNLEIFGVQSCKYCNFTFVTYLADQCFSLETLLDVFNKKQYWARMLLKKFAWLINNDQARWVGGGSNRYSENHIFVWSNCIELNSGTINIVVEQLSLFIVINLVICLLERKSFATTLTPKNYHNSIKMRWRVTW